MIGVSADGHRTHSEYGGDLRPIADASVTSKRKGWYIIRFAAVSGGLPRREGRVYQATQLVRVRNVGSHPIPIASKKNIAAAIRRMSTYTGDTQRLGARSSSGPRRSVAEYLIPANWNEDGTVT